MMDFVEIKSNEIIEIVIYVNKKLKMKSTF